MWTCQSSPHGDGRVFQSTAWGKKGWAGVHLQPTPLPSDVGDSKESKVRSRAYRFQKHSRIYLARIRHQERTQTATDCDPTTA